jgi:uncharacterized protein YbaP (TraB family)
MKTIQFLLLLLFVTNSAFAQNEKSLCWKISGHGLQKPSYIYGTIHIACPNDIIIPEPVKTAFGSSEQVYLEIKMDDPEMMAKMQPKMMLPQGHNIKELLTAEDYKTIDAHLTAKMGAGLTQLGIMKPFAIFTMVMASMLPCSSQGYETAFMTLAKEQKKEISGLETIEYQLSLFGKIPDKELVHITTDMIKKKDVFDKELTQLMEFYKKQEIDSLLTLMNSSEWNFKGFEDDFVYNRNSNWASQIPKLAVEKSTFFAVGAAHLGGDRGVLQLLRKAGYTIKPVR